MGRQHMARSRIEGDRGIQRPYDGVDDSRDRRDRKAHNDSGSLCDTRHIQDSHSVGQARRDNRRQRVILKLRPDSRWKGQARHIGTGMFHHLSPVSLRRVRHKDCRLLSRGRRPHIRVWLHAGDKHGIAIRGRRRGDMAAGMPHTDARGAERDYHLHLTPGQLHWLPAL